MPRLWIEKKHCDAPCPFTNARLHPVAFYFRSFSGSPPANPALSSSPTSSFYNVIIESTAVVRKQQAIFFPFFSIQTSEKTPSHPQPPFSWFEGERENKNVRLRAVLENAPLAGIENDNLPLERYFAQTRNKNKITTRLYVILWSYIIVRKKRNKKAHANTSKNGQIAWSSNFVICETIVSYLIFIFWIFQDEILVTFIMSLVCVFVSPRSRYISYFFIESFCFFLLKTFLIKW